MDPQLQCVFVANGELHAQQVRAFLESAGVSTVESGEALRNTHGLTLDGLGSVRIYVAASDAAEARSLLSSAEAGGFRVDDAGDAAEGESSTKHDSRNTEDKS
jgi:Putative prokaryotic signal transducing protein